MKATKAVQRIWNSFGRRGLACFLLLISLASASAVHAKEINKKALDLYLDGAFADTERLVKFAHMPSILIYCGDETCRPVGKNLSEILPNVRMIKGNPTGIGADIMIFLFDARMAVLRYSAKEDVKVRTLAHPNCSLVQYRRGFEVVRVIVTTTQSEAKETLICILNEVLGGSGVSVRGRNAEDLSAYSEMNESQLAVVHSEFSRLMAIHSLEITAPGQDKASVERALKHRFKIDN